MAPISSETRSLSVRYLPASPGVFRAVRALLHAVISLLCLPAGAVAAVSLSVPVGDER